MFVFDIASHERVVPLWCAVGRSASRSPAKASTRQPEARAYRVADAVIELARLGVLRTGDKLPSERRLAALLDISRDAVRVALDVLQQRRVLKKRHGARTELCGAGMDLDAPVVPLATACLDLEASLNGTPASAASNELGTSFRPLVEDLIRLATAHAREAADAEALAVCRRMADGREVQSLAA